MKLPAYLDYSAEGTKLCECGLLTIWGILRDYSDDLVLVGGLVPRYICKPHKHDIQPVTMDIDLGIAIGTESGLYASVSDRLKDEGFIPVKAAAGHDQNRLIKNLSENTKLTLDLLTERPTLASPESVQVEGLWINAFLGIDRALSVSRKKRTSGIDLMGASVTEEIRIAEIGPFLCLKLNAYSGRAQNKDVFDVVYSVLNYDRGYPEAARLFREEAGHNLAYETAINVLEERFTDSRAKGPMQYADFLTSGQTGPDLQEQRERLANEAVDAAILLLGR